MQLKKYGLNLISVTALGIGSVVGAGIFALLGQVIMMAGDQTYYAFIIAGVAALFSGYSYSRLAAAYPDSGGLTDYFHIAFKKRWCLLFVRDDIVVPNEFGGQMSGVSFDFVFDFKSNIRVVS